MTNIEKQFSYFLLSQKKLTELKRKIFFPCLLVFLSACLNFTFIGEIKFISTQLSELVSGVFANDKKQRRQC